MSPNFCRRPQPELLTGIPTIVCSAIDALEVIGAAVSVPARPQLIGLGLTDRTGHTILVCDDADDPDAVLHGAEYLSHHLIEQVGRPGELVLATRRPRSGVLPGDVDRWFHADAIADDLGCELLDWFVLHDGPPVSVRQIAGDPPRW